MTQLAFIKTIHTAIWFFFNAVIFYLLFAVVSNRIGWPVWVCFGIILAEAAVLIGFKGNCPLTLVARKYSDSTADNFDIYLPEWLAKYNKAIYSTIFAVIIATLIYRLTIG